MTQTQPEFRRPSYFAANALFLLAAMGLVLLPPLAEALAVLLLRAFPKMSAEALLLWTSLVYYVPCVLLPAGVYIRRRRLWQAARLEQPLSPFSALLAVLAALLCVPLGADLAVLWEIPLQRLGLIIPESDVYIPETARGLALTVFYLGVVPGVAEELTFRGVILSAWERRGPVRAVLVSSLLFASLHGSVAGFPTQFMLGCVICLLAVGSGSVYAGMIFHTLYNSALLMAQYAAQRSTYVDAEALADDALLRTDALAWLGGLPGLLSTLGQIALLGVILALLLRAVWTRGRREGVVRPPREPGGMTAQEALVLLSGVVTVLFLYGTDLLDMLGVWT